MIKFFNKYKWIVISALIGIIFFIAAIINFNFDKVINNFEKISVFKFIIYFIASLATFLVGVWRWHVILRSYSFSVHFAKLFLWRLAGWTGSYLTPTAYIGGEPIRALFISKETGINFKSALANVIADSFLNIFTEIILTCVGAFFAFLHFSSILRFEDSFIIAVIMIFIAIYYLYRRIANGKFLLYPVLKFFRINRWKPVLTKEIFEFEGLFIDFFKNKKEALRKGFLISIVLYSFSLIEFWLLAFFLGITFSLWHVILFKAFMVIGYILPIPAGIGMAEFSLAKFFEIFGYDPSIGVAYSLLIRVKDSLLAIFGFFVLSGYGISFLKPAFTFLKQFFKKNVNKFVKFNGIDQNDQKI